MAILFNLLVKIQFNCFIPDSTASYTYWKEINRISKCKVSLPNCIDGVTGAGNICELWKNHFHQLLNCIHDDDALHVDVI